jgi:type II secretory pathway pseudopilin PulG
MRLSARRPRQQGLVALLLAVTLLVTLGTTLVLSELGQRREVGDQQALTQQRLLALRQALVNFASANGRLPCPASGALDTGLAVPNGAAAACTNPNGTVPWTTLGLPRDAALDAWGRKVSYRVFAGATGLTVVGGASMVECDSDFTSPPPATAAAPAASAAAAAPNFQCTAAVTRINPASVLDPIRRRGLAVYDESQATTTVWQVALVLISHGASGAGAWTTGGLQQALPPVANAVERANGLVLNAAAVPIDPNTCPLPPAVMPAPPICHYRLNKSDATVALTANNHFDDQVVYVTFTDLFREAGRAPRNW